MNHIIGNVAVGLAILFMVWSIYDLWPRRQPRKFPYKEAVGVKQFTLGVGVVRTIDVM